MLREIAIMSTILHCDFCGTLHATEDDAIKHGCTAGTPPMRFSVGDIVKAQFSMGVGNECLGKETAHGKIVKVQHPFAHGYEITRCPLIKRIKNKSFDELSFNAPIATHAWAYVVTPCRQSRSFVGSFSARETFLEHQLTATDS